MSREAVLREALKQATAALGVIADSPEVSTAVTDFAVDEFRKARKALAAPEDPTPVVLVRTSGKGDVHSVYVLPTEDRARQYVDNRHPGNGLNYTVIRPEIHEG
jgi:hypothetical protein